MFTIDVSSVAIKIPMARIARTAHLFACSCPSSLLGSESLVGDGIESFFPWLVEVPAEMLCFTRSVSFCCIPILLRDSLTACYIYITVSLLTKHTYDPIAQRNRLS